MFSPLDQRQRRVGAGVRPREVVGEAWMRRRSQPVGVVELGLGSPSPGLWAAAAMAAAAASKAMAAREAASFLYLRSLRHSASGCSPLLNSYLCIRASLLSLSPPSYARHFLSLGSSALCHVSPPYLLNCRGANILPRLARTSEAVAVVHRHQQCRQSGGLPLSHCRMSEWQPCVMRTKSRILAGCPLLQITDGNLAAAA